MKGWLVALGAFVIHAASIPTMAEALMQGAMAEKLEARQQTVPFPPFNAKEQLVSVEGEHAFVAPDFAAGDVRGPCPGLNAMANHGYLPHNGVGTIVDFVQGTFDVFGMGPDVAGFLSVLAAVLDGNGLQWSIGGPSNALPGAPPLIGTPQGISASHNRYEGDVSLTRGDLYKYGNDYLLQMSEFEELYKMGEAAGNVYSHELIHNFRAKRFNNSVETNPYFFDGTFPGLLAAPAAYEFTYRLMSNKSAEYPSGILQSSVLMEFFSITKDSNGKLVYTPGFERIPYNWYKRALTDPYTFPLVSDDLIHAAAAHPEFLTVGGNLGKPNTFTGVDIGMLSGGVYNTQTLLQGNNLVCLAMQFAVQTAPDAIRCSSVLGKAEESVKLLNAQLAKSISGLECPTLGRTDEAQFGKYPGYSKLNCKTGTYSDV